MIKIKSIEISATTVSPHGVVFFAMVKAVATTIKGLAPDKKELSDNWFDITVSNHYGNVTAGHALTMLMKKCKRLSMRIDKDAEICWASNDIGPIDPIIHPSLVRDRKRMNSIIKTLAKKHKMKAILPYPEESPAEKND